MRLIYDTEIKRAIPPKLASDRIPGIEYCKGWTDFVGMGISVISFALLGDDLEPVGEAKCMLWGDEAKQTLIDSRAAGVKIGGFNSKRFDDKLLQAHGVDLVSDFDIYQMVLEAAGQSATYRKGGRKYNLDAIGTANDVPKNGHGSEAPILWQRGKIDELISYGGRDAHVERDVVARLLKGTLIDPNDGELLLWREG